MRAPQVSVRLGFGHQGFEPGCGEEEPVRRAGEFGEVNVLRERLGGVIDAVAGGGLPSPFSGVVGSFADADPAGAVADYAALIDWGDGSIDPGAIAPNPGGGVRDLSPAQRAALKPGEIASWLSLTGNC